MGGLRGVARGCASLGVVWVLYFPSWLALWLNISRCVALSCFRWGVYGLCA